MTNRSILHYVLSLTAFGVFILLVAEDAMSANDSFNPLFIAVLIVLMGLPSIRSVADQISRDTDDFENEMVSDPVERVKRKYKHRDMTEAEFEEELEDALERTGAWKPDENSDTKQQREQ